MACIYSVGDKLVLRSDLDVDTPYHMQDNSDWWYPTQQMVAAAGTVVVITECHNRWYKADGFDKDDWFTDEMFTGYYFEPEEDLFPVYPVNDYSRSCWYCHPGAIVDKLVSVTGHPVLCPHCSRVCYPVLGGA